MPLLYGIRHAWPEQAGLDVYKRQGKVSLLSGACFNAARNYVGDIAPDIPDEGSGRGPEQRGNPCGLPEQLTYIWSVQEGIGIREGRTISHHLCGAGAAGDGGIPGFFQNCQNFHGCCG